MNEGMKVGLITDSFGRPVKDVRALADGVVTFIRACCRSALARP